LHLWTVTIRLFYKSDSLVPHQEAYKGIWVGSRNRTCVSGLGFRSNYYIRHFVSKGIILNSVFKRATTTLSRLIAVTKGIEPLSSLLLRVCTIPIGITNVRWHFDFMLCYHIFCGVVGTRTQIPLPVRR